MVNRGVDGFGLRGRARGTPRSSSDEGISPSRSNIVACEKLVLRAAVSLDLRLDFLALVLLLVGCGSIVTALWPRETPSEMESLLSDFPAFGLAFSSTSLDVSGCFGVLSETPPVSGAVTYPSPSDPGLIFSSM